MSITPWKRKIPTNNSSTQKETFPFSPTTTRSTRKKKTLHPRLPQPNATTLYSLPTHQTSPGAFTAGPGTYATRIPSRALVGDLPRDHDVERRYQRASPSRALELLPGLSLSYGEVSRRLIWHVEKRFARDTVRLRQPPIKGGGFVGIYMIVC